MKRNFLMKAFVCLFTVVALCSCNENEDGKDDDDKISGIYNNTLIVVVENGANYNGEIDVVKLEIEYSDENHQYAKAMFTSASYINGGFLLDLPESVNAQYLVSFDFEEGVPESLTVSNLNAKTGWVDLNAYKSNSKTGYFYHGTEEWEGVLVYSDSDLDITGSYTDTDTYSEITYTYKETYNVHGKRGWNMVYYKETDKGNNSEEYEYTTQVPAGAKWYFHNNSYEPSSISGSLLKPKTLLSAKRTFGLK